MLGVAYGTWGNVNTKPAAITRHILRQPTPLVITTVVICFRAKREVIAFLSRATAATTTAALTATAWRVGNNFDTATLDATRLLYRFCLWDEDPASTSTGLASPLAPQQPPPPPRSNMNRLLKTAPLVPEIDLRCGWEEVKMQSPTGMLHLTSPLMSNATCPR